MKRPAQAILDYVFLLLVVIATLLVMGYYIRNSLSGKFRENADTFGRGEFYRPNIDGVDNPSNVTTSITNQ